MCVERAVSALYLEECDKVAQAEWIQHTDFVAKVSGLNPFKQAEKALSRTYDRLDIDFVWLSLIHI